MAGGRSERGEPSSAMAQLACSLHYYKKKLNVIFKKTLGGRQKFQPPRLMPQINRGGHFLLTEAVTKNRLAKSIYGGGHYKITASKNSLFSEVLSASLNQFTEAGAI